MDEKRRNPIQWLLLGVGIIFLWAGLTYTLLQRQKAPAIPPTPTPATVEEVQRVSLADAKAAFDSGSAIFLDVRDGAAYARSHIRGAVLITLSELPDRMGELNSKAWIIPYCT